ncbi:hypothetical protein GCM10027284_42210 [Cyclobacterium sediminis]|mgnify:FL=1|tara:strand:- start:11 stop:289 length:279 start_codon:yes stop_codon:yes gene_type:complete
MSINCNSDIYPWGIEGIILRSCIPGLTLFRFFKYRFNLLNIMKIQNQIEEHGKEFTPRELLFANYYLGKAKLNATKAVKLAGYRHNTAREQG